MLKLILLLLPLLAFGYSTKKGPMTIGDTQKKPDATAILELFSVEKGFLPPRMDTVQRDAITAPATGLEIYNTDRNTPEFFNGTAWIQSGGTGTSFQVMQAAHGRALGCPLTPVYWNGTVWANASADATSTLGTHVITKVIDANTFEVSQSGKFECIGHGLTPALHYYVEVGGGLRTTPAPVFNNPVLLVEDANTVHVMPYRASSTVATTVGQVDTVFGRAGNVVAQAGDYSADLVTFTPTGALTTTTVQAAIAELDLIVSSQDPSGKADNSIQITVGDGLTGGGDLTANRNIDLDLGSLPSDIVQDTDSLVFLDGSDSDNPKTVSISDILGLQTFSLDDLTDVSTVGFLAGQVLEFDGTNFVAGNKTMGTDNQQAFEVPFAPNGDISATDVQAAIQEVRDDTDAKVAAVVQPSRQVLAGTGLSGGGPLSSDVTLSADPSNIDITALQNFNADSYIDHSTISIDVTDMNDGILALNPTLDNDVILRIDIPSLDRENPVLTNTDFLAFSLSAGKLVKASAGDIADAAAAAVSVPVTTVNSEIGDVVLTSDDIDDAGQTNKWATQAELDDIAANTSQLAINTPQIVTNTSNISNNTSAISVNTGNISSNDTDIANNTTNISSNTTALAGLATVANSGDYNDLINLPTLGTAADNAETDFATAAQGALADSALQSGDNVSELVNDANYITVAAIPVNNVNGQTGNVVLDADDIDDSTTTNKFATAAQLSQIATNTSDISTANGNIATNTTNIATNTSDISTANGNIATNATNIASNDTDIATNASGISTNAGNISTNTGNISTNTTNIASNTSAISGLATVASSGDYNDLINLPTLGTAAAEDIGFFATAAQGALADSALQSGDNVSELTNDANYITLADVPADAVSSVNTQTGAVVLDADDIDDSATTNKFATTAQLNQIATNATDISTNSSDIGTNATAIGTNASNISTNLGNINTNTSNISNNTTNISNNATAISTKAEDSIILTAGNGLVGGGDLTANRAFSVSVSRSIGINADSLQLIGDVDTPTALQYYGSDAGGAKGWYDIPVDTFTATVAADAGTDITVAEAEELTDGSTTELHKHKNIRAVFGRWELFTDNRWVTWSDINFGINQADWDLTGGTGATPNVDWDGMGMSFPAGTVLNRAIGKCASNSTEVGTPEVFFRVHDTDFEAGLAIDSNGEVGAVTVLAPTALTGLPTNKNDMHGWTVSLGDYTMVNNGDLHMFLRNTGTTVTATRFYRCSVTIEYTLP